MRLLYLAAGFYLSCVIAFAADAEKTIVFLGDSLTAGYGVSPEEAYPALIQQRIRDEALPYRVVPAGISGDTSSGVLRRLDWIMQQRFDILVLAIGGNDGLRGLPVEELEKNLIAIIEKVRARYPDATIILAGMKMPPNMGLPYASAFAGVYPRVAKQADVRFIPFLLEGVAGKPKLNQDDTIHPTAEGQKIIADIVWKSLKPLL